MDIASIITTLKAERARIEKELERVGNVLKALSGGTNSPSDPKFGTKRMSAAARARIAAAQRARWAKIKATKKAA